MAVNSELSEREIEILSLVASGKSNKEIALELYISANTVKVHLRNIFAKIEVSSRTEATLFAIRAGMVKGVAEITPNGKGIPTKEEKIADITHPSQEDQIVNKPEVGTASSKWMKFSWGFIGLITLFLLAGMGFSRFAQRSLSPTPEIIVSTENNRWEIRAELSLPRSGQATTAYENKIYVIGGETPAGIISSTDSYDPDTNRWTSLAAKPTAVTDVQAAVLGGKLYVPGGRTISGEVTNLLEIYDPKENIWNTGASLPLKLSGYALIAFEGKLYLFGGWDGENYSNKVFVYNPDFKQWNEQANLPSPRAFLSAVVASNKIFVIGGFDGNEAMDSNLIYFPERHQNNASPWENAAPLPMGRYAMGTAYLADTIYVLSGLQQDKTPAPQLIFHYANNQWNIRPDSKNTATPIWSHIGVAVIGSDVYAIGGLVDGILTNQVFSFQAVYTIPLPVIIKP